MATDQSRDEREQTPTGRSPGGVAMTDFEVYDPCEEEQPSAALRLRPHGRIELNAAAVGSLRVAAVLSERRRWDRRVHLLFSRATQQLGLRPAAAATRMAFTLDPLRSGDGRHVLCVASALRYFGVPADWQGPDPEQWFPASVVDGVLQTEPRLSAALEIAKSGS